MKRSLLLFSFVCFGLFLSTNPAAAQQQEGQRPRGGFGGGRGFGGGGFGFSEQALLGNEQVQKELELSADQVAKLTKLREDSQAEMRKQFEGIRELPEDQRRAKFEEMRTKGEAAQKEHRSKVNEVLLPDQRERLKELAVQAQGTGALFNPETAEALKLTEEQKKKLETIREESGNKMRELFSGGRGQAGGPNEEARTKMAEIRKESGDKSLAVLTSEQAAQFEKMKGEKSSIDFTQMRGGFGGGRGPGGGRPGGNNNGGNNN